MERGDNSSSLLVIGFIGPLTRVPPHSIPQDLGRTNTLTVVFLYSHLAVCLEDDVGVHPPGCRGLPQPPTALAHEGQLSGREECALREQLARRLPVQDQLYLPLLRKRRQGGGTRGRSKAGAHGDGDGDGDGVA